MNEQLKQMVEEGDWVAEERSNTYNLRILATRKPITPRQLLERHPITPKAEKTVIEARQSIEAILDGRDSRMLLIVGPCSVHDPEQALEYAKAFKKLQDEVEDRILMLMRLYFEKPRTNIGWQGLIVDPHLDGSYAKDEGYTLARKLLLDTANEGIAAATELLETFTPQYLSDLIAWAAIGARTVESQEHRKMASGLSMPVGYKNGTSGSLTPAVNALQAAQGQHTFPGIDMDGMHTTFLTSGNPYGHVVLRGGGGKTNYDAASVAAAQDTLVKAQLDPNVFVDCSHDNSVDAEGKDYTRQINVFQDVVAQRAAGNKHLVGAMLESNIHAGNQKMPNNLHGFDKRKLKPGISVTDPCIDMEQTNRIVHEAFKTLSPVKVAVSG